MRASLPRVLRALPVLLAVAPAAMTDVSASEVDLAVRGGIVHTVAGPPIENGVVLISEGRIVAVGPAGEVSAPQGVREVFAPVVTPGLVDAHSVVGLSGHLNQSHDQEQLELSTPIQPELRAIDAFDARERLLRWVRSFGVTTVHTGHAPGALVSGQTMIAKTRGDTVDQAVVVERAMLAAALGRGALRRGEAGEVPGTRSKAVALLRAELIRAREYRARRESAAADEPLERDLGLEVLADVLDRELPMIVTAQRHQDIVAALRLASEFGFRLVLDGAAEAYAVLEELRSAGVPVIVHPPMARHAGELENASFETAARLADAGLLIAMQSGYESYVPKTRVVLFEAAVAAANSLGFERALRAVTIDAARIIGLEQRIGSIEPGKDADLALYDGDPFEYTTHCLGVVIEGDLFAAEPR
jgi:imidazolonepropionase-like amidohydrolase